MNFSSPQAVIRFIAGATLGVEFVARDLGTQVAYMDNQQKQWKPNRAAEQLRALGYTAMADQLLGGK